MGKNSRKCMGILIIDAMVILPFVKTSQNWKMYHENEKFTIKIWKINRFIGIFR
jgi:hypothetical protein